MAETATPKPRKSPPARKRRPKKPQPRVWRNVALVAGLVFLLDQALKYLVVHVLRLDQLREIDVIDPWLNLRMAWNQGMNFGLFASDVDVMRWVLIAIALAVCLWVGIWVGRAKPSRFAQISAGLLIGGALGNVVDRLTYGAVADFLNMSLPGWRNPYSFNVADIAIFLGAMGLVLLPPDKKPAKKRKGPAKPRPAQPRASQAPPPPQPQGEAAPDDKARDEGGNTR
ncbi:signal peptidase II Aspartic peptidase. MEROPS family A08 [Paracoccus thiocyanatus]|uniref:Lipoprotein signal peptidase n=1 Tax=Paracoccus thiocyanatus TaxID=34006 RepID=A0A1N6VBJ4_9RHOB|nr:signal peptidase II [Paracoccus thiocyanatus]SIQ75137.1 signal peptidase II Aspartic peptidase. MEROPS family A08 [Paracoccus thiocyanatus]